jgi:hypothetical protein
MPQAKMSLEFEVAAVPHNRRLEQNMVIPYNGVVTTFTASSSKFACIYTDEHIS